MSGDHIRFGRFRLDLGRRELSRDGVPMHLGARVIDILCVLVSAKGDVITKDELMARVWPGLVVEEGNIHVHISAIRKALDDGKSGQNYVMTVPGRGYRFIGLQPPLPADKGEPDTREGLSLPDRPSIAVLPFTNLSGNPEQEYFADGVVEEIITALCRFSSLFVIARNSSFTYKGRAVDVKQVGRELGVRYVLEGSVRKTSNRVRVTGQLIDASTGAHIWADRFDGALEDIFDLQDQVTSRVVGAIVPKLEQAEIERAKRKPTESLDAYEYFLHGMASYYQRTREATNEALRLFYRAVEVDPDFASAYGMAAWCYGWRQANGWMIDRAEEVAESGRLARRAAELGPDDAVALSRGAHALAFVVGDLDDAATFVERAIMLNPNLVAAWHASGWVRIFRGEPDLAIEHFAHAMRLSPLDPHIISMQAGTAFSHLLAGRYDEASCWAEKGMWAQPNYMTPLRIAAASNALAGRLTEAKEAVTRLLELDPALRIANVKERAPLRRPEDLARLVEGLRKAGLPEI